MSSLSPSIRVACRTLSLEQAGLEALRAALESSVEEDSLAACFEKTVACLLSSTGRVIVTGMGKSGHIGRKIAATLASTGTPAYFVHPGEASHGDLGMIQAGDSILALSWSGETAELASIATYARRFSIPLIAMTENRLGTLAQQADISLVLPHKEEACPNGLAPTTSSLMQLALGDALAIALLEARGFTAQDFRLFHPGGRLGARLTFVRDVMHRHEKIPHIFETERMSAAIVEISAKGFGCVAVVDKDHHLRGVITDGDLRRHMCPDLMMRVVSEIMTVSPRIIKETTLAVEALSLLNKHKITALFVLDEEDRLVGIVHLHDLLRLGVA